MLIVSLEINLYSTYIRNVVITFTIVTVIDRWKISRSSVGLLMLMSSTR